MLFVVCPREIFMYKIIEKSVPAEKINRSVILAQEISKKAQPGQFVILRLNETGERIPITISDCDAVNGTITIFVQEVGGTTKEMGLLKPGDGILDVVGPLGVPSHIENYGTVICVGGGVGAAVLYPVTKALKKNGNRVITVLGARSGNMLILEKEMKEVSDEFIAVTDDGSYGKKGFVTDSLREIFESRPSPVADLVFAIGPVPMMKAVSKMTELLKIKTIVSLNPIMVDGTGMCGACRVTVGGSTKFACVDGPDFDGHLVDWQELSNRLRFYKKEEEAALKHACKLSS